VVSGIPDAGADQHEGDRVDAKSAAGSSFGKDQTGVEKDRKREIFRGGEKKTEKHLSF